MRTRYWNSLNVHKGYTRKIIHIGLGRSYWFVKDFSLPTTCVLGGYIWIWIWDGAKRERSARNAVFAVESAAISPSTPYSKSLNTDHAEGTMGLVVRAGHDIHMQEKQKREWGNLLSPLGLVRFPFLAKTLPLIGAETVFLACLIWVSLRPKHLSENKMTLKPLLQDYRSRLITQEPRI